MKLYTEEQVRLAMDFARGHNKMTDSQFIDLLIPIELPSDEEIEESSLKWFMTANKHEIIFDLGWMKIFKAGAKMVINKIQGGKQ